MLQSDFTRKLAFLIIRMRQEGENPILDYVMRDAKTQNRLFREGKSKCDGYKKKSQHQRRKAGDIYLTTSKGKPIYVWDKKKAIYWHKVWEEGFGGRPIIKWDHPHFEVR